MTVLKRLADALRAEGGLLAAAVHDSDAAAPLGALAASGPRAAGHEADLELVVEAVYEGYLLHHGAPRVVADCDPDLALLAGDRLYALGLERLAAAGDLHAVGVLAEVIAVAARAHAEGEGERVAALWEASAVAVGRGYASDG